MNLLLKVLFPVLALIGSALIAKTILDNRPEPRKRPQFPSVQAVDAITLSKSNYPVVINTQGTVRPTQSSTLVAEVTGTVTNVSENFVLGGRFSKGDVLIQIDERDYAIALTQANANLAQASAALQEEIARGQMAKSEWESLRSGEQASPITLRVPQLAAARANRDAASAQVERAKLDLERTKLLAPFNGQVSELAVDQGQFVSRGARLGQIYSNQSVDVRLPLTSRQLTFLDIPSSGSVPQSQLPNIELAGIVAGVEQSWTGKVIRAEGVDASTQQLNVIARVASPFAPGKAPLRIDQYVEAKIAGRVLEDVFVLPREALREDREVLLVNKDNQLERREVIVVWADEQSATISDGLEVGDVLVTTPLSTVTNGTPVRATIDGKAPSPTEGRRQGSSGGKGKFNNGERSGEGRRGESKTGEDKPSPGKPEDDKPSDAKPGATAPVEKKRGEEGGNSAQLGPNTGADENTDANPAIEIVSPQKPAAGKIKRADDTVSN